MIESRCKRCKKKGDTRLGVCYGCAVKAEQAHLKKLSRDMKARIDREQRAMHHKSRHLGSSDRRGTGHTHPPGKRRCPKCGV